MRAIVTGSSGFLGRHFVRHLNRKGWLVTPVDVKGDNPIDARDVFRRWSGPWDLAIHCAAVVNGRQTIERRPMDQVVDFELDAGFFRWLSDVEVTKAVYFSSSAAYPVAYQGGNPYQLSEGDIDLDHPELPDALYGWTKLTGEMLAREAVKSGQNVLVVRPFSGYGEDQDDCYPFPAIMQRAVKRESPCVVWGSGNQIRDFVHVDDIVEAVMTLVEIDNQGPINISTGRPTSMTELARMASKAVGYEPQITPLSDEPAGVMYRVGNPSNLEPIYTPKISLEEGVDRAIHYLSQA